MRLCSPAMVSGSASDLPALTMQIARAGRGEASPAALIAALDEVISIEDQEPGTLRRFKPLREEVIRAAFRTRTGLYTADMPFALVGAGVSLSGLLVTWWKDPLRELLGPSLGTAVCLGLIGFVGVAMVGFVLLYFWRRAWMQCEKKLSFLADVLRRRGAGTGDGRIAQILDDVAAGAPDPLR